MGIQTVDLILIHWPNDHMKIEDQVKNFEAVFSEGLTRYIGVSNFSVEQMEEARLSTTSAEIMYDQVKYNLSERGAEKDIIPYCERNKIAVMAYTPIEKGKTSRMKEIKEISKKIDKTPIQVALNFLASRNNVIPIPKTENLEHMKEIIGSQGWKLNSEDLERIKNLKMKRYSC
jgi:diketogulonate reductase-like aldo/keto reductase